MQLVYWYRLSRWCSIQDYDKRWIRKCITWTAHSRKVPSWTRICFRLKVFLWAMRFSVCQMLQVSLRCTSLRRRKTSHCLGESISLALGPIQITTLIITSNICECRIVATAFMIKSTLGLSIVDPMKMELIVENFLSSILSNLFWTKISYYLLFLSY